MRVYICKIIEKFQKYNNLIYLIIKHMHKVKKKNHNTCIKIYFN